VYTTPKKFLIFRGKPLSDQAIFGRLRKNRSAAQRARGSSTKTSDRQQKVPGLVSKRDGVAVPS